MKLILHPEFSLYERNGQPYCDSLQVAETFSKSHDNILRGIRNTMAAGDEDFNLLNFEEIKYKDPKGRQYPKYLLTKDAFTLLVMGYTGKKAMKFKIAYINRFNQMDYHNKLHLKLVA